MGLLYNEILRVGAKMKHPRPQDRQWLEKLRRAPIYELSDVIPLFADCNAHNNQTIPKRPPHDLMWAEWKWCEQDSTDWTVGAILERMNIDGADYVKAEEQVPPGAREAILGPKAKAFSRAIGSLTLSDESRRMIRESIACYRLDLLIHISAPNTPEIQPGRISQKIGHYLIFFGDEYQTARHVRRMPIDRRELCDWSIFGLPAQLALHTESNPLCAPWPMEMCFSLLNCRNVVTETITPMPKQIRQAHREHRQADPSYKIIRLEKPIRRVDAGESEGDRHQRFHLVRGHFKNLQANRYLHKGWHWWPEHWRGDEKLGTIKTVSVLKS